MKRIITNTLDCEEIMESCSYLFEVTDGIVAYKFKKNGHLMLVAFPLNAPGGVSVMDLPLVGILDTNREYIDQSRDDVWFDYTDDIIALMAMCNDTARPVASVTKEPMVTMSEELWQTIRMKLILSDADLSGGLLGRLYSEVKRV